MGQTKISDCKNPNQKTQKIVPQRILKINSSDLFVDYLKIIRPFHDLTDTEIKVAAEILRIRSKYAPKILDEELLDSILLNTESRKIIREKLNMQLPQLQNIIKKLKASKFLTESMGVNKQFIPKFDENTKEFDIIFKLYERKQEPEAVRVQDADEGLQEAGVQVQPGADN